MIDLAQRRRLGRSAVSVSPLGFGGNALPLRRPVVAAVVAGCRTRFESEQSLALLAEPIPVAFWLAVDAAGSEAGARVAEPVR